MVRLTQDSLSSRIDIEIQVTTRLTATALSAGHERARHKVSPFSIGSGRDVQTLPWGFLHE